MADTDRADTERGKAAGKRTLPLVLPHNRFFRTDNSHRDNGDLRCRTFPFLYFLNSSVFSLSSSYGVLKHRYSDGNIRQ